MVCNSYDIIDECVIASRSVSIEASQCVRYVIWQPCVTQSRWRFSNWYFHYGYSTILKGSENLNNVKEVTGLGGMLNIFFWTEVYCMKATALCPSRLLKTPTSRLQLEKNNICSET